MDSGCQRCCLDTTNGLGLNMPVCLGHIDMFLLGQLNRDAYMRCGFWTVAVTGAVLVCA
jgi:hypothetical protein